MRENPPWTPAHPGRSLRVGLAILALLAPWTAAQDRRAAAAGDRRTTEVLSYGCGSEFGHRDITLFANGTVRLREGPWHDQKLYLNELDPEAVEDNLRVLRSLDLERGIDRIRIPVEQGIGGRWMERCRVRLDLPELAEPVEYELSSFDVPPLAISRLIHIAEELAKYVRPVAEEPTGIPAGYEPKFGDVLRTAEGLRFKVLRLTSDKRGVELEGIDQPLRIYVALTELSQAFVVLEERDDRAFWWRQ